MAVDTTSPSGQPNRTAILIVLALGTFILGLSEFSMMPMLPLISEAFGSTPSQSGYAISAYALCNNQCSLRTNFIGNSPPKR